MMHIAMITKKKIEVILSFNNKKINKAIIKELAKIHVCTFSKCVIDVN